MAEFATEVRRMGKAKCCLYAWLGRVEYMEALHIQKSLARARAERRIADALVFLEHPPTYTLGRRAREEHFLVPRETLEQAGFAVHRTDRGGDVTFHGPGQLVGYPVISLEDRPGGPGKYLRDVEDVIIHALACFGLQGKRLEGYTGVWIGLEKIAAIGVKIDVNRITQHGFALNVNTDLDYFKNIIPCGIREHGVTSLAHVLGRSVSLEDLACRLASAFSLVFGIKMVKVGLEEMWDIIESLLATIGSVM